jgi:hypothetical protein
MEDVVRSLKMLSQKGVGSADVPDVKAIGASSRACLHDQYLPA